MNFDYPIGIQGKPMKPEQLYNELKNLSEKVDLHVSEQNFRTTGIRVKSGYCKVKEEHWCIIDKHAKLSQKIEALAECLCEMPLESIYILPAVREYLDGFTPKRNSIDGQENKKDSDGV
jgi:hypothetical protein